MARGVSMKQRFDLDLRSLDRGFKELTKAGKNFKPVFSRLRGFIRRDQQRHFKEQRGPEGKWPPLSSATLQKRLERKNARANKRGTRKRKRTTKRIFGNKMPNAAAMQVDVKRMQIAISSRIEWADSHQFGKRVGRGVKLPERTHIWLSDEFISIALKQMLQHMQKKWGGR